MGKRRIGFKETDDKPGIYDRFIGEYVVIYGSQNRTFAGRLIRIDEDYAVLNPFQGAVWNEKRGLTRKLVKRDSIVFLPGTSIEPSTRRNLMAYCRYENKRELASKTKTRS